MSRHSVRSPLAVLLSLIVLLLPSGALAQDASPAPGPPPLPAPSANVMVFATGLDNPRGLKFDADGTLYVAEGGQGGTTATDEAQCEQVVPPVGPYTGGNTSRLSTLNASGQRTTVIEGLPSTQTAPTLGNMVSGVADIAFVDGTLYYVMAGAGCSHGHPDVPNGVFRVNDDGTSELVADLSAFVKANPTAVTNPGDFEPDEGAYAMIEHEGMLYVVHPNHGALEKIDPTSGTITRVIDFTETENHLVPTAIAVGPDGNFYIGNLTTFPVTAGVATIYQLTPDGQLSHYAEGLTAVTGVAFDDQGRLYVLETSGPGGPDGPVVPGTGRVLRQTDDGGFEVIATGLVFPTAMTFGPDGLLYVSDYGFGFPPGAGQIVTIDLSMPLPDEPMVMPEATPAM